MANDQPLAERLMVLSIHPRHVDAILDGKKTIELRRTRPNVLPGQPVAIYATSPAAALVATCSISLVATAVPKELWPEIAGQAGVTKREYDAYFRGSQTAVALHLADVRPLGGTVSLSHLRQQAAFSPPQTWHFFDRQRLTALLGRHPSSPSLTGLLAEPG